MKSSVPIFARAQDKPARLAWCALLALMIAFTVFVRIRLLNLPLERDEGEYAYAGQLLLQGIPPYQLAYNMKFPGTYAASAVLMAAFGQTNRRGASRSSRCKRGHDRTSLFPRPPPRK